MTIKVTKLSDYYLKAYLKPAVYTAVVSQRPPQNHRQRSEIPDEFRVVTSVGKPVAT